MEKKFEPKPGDKIVGRSIHGIDLSTIYPDKPYFIPNTVSYIKLNANGTGDISLEDKDYLFICNSDQIRLYSEFEDNYQNVMDVEVGDTVRCVPENNSRFSYYAGSGWEEDLEFVVTTISNCNNYKVYFGGKRDNGVYSDAVRLVKRKESKYPEYVECPVNSKGLTLGKRYRVIVANDRNFKICDDKGSIIICTWEGDYHLDWVASWIKVWENDENSERNITSPKKASDFIAGNWYKFQWDNSVYPSYAKCIRADDTYMHFDKRITGALKSYKKDSGKWCYTRTDVKVSLADIMEIYNILHIEEKDEPESGKRWYGINQSQSTSMYIGCDPVKDERPELVIRKPKKLNYTVNSYNINNNNTLKLKKDGKIKFVR